MRADCYERMGDYVKAISDIKWVTKIAQYVYPGLIKYWNSKTRVCAVIKHIGLSEHKCY